MTETHAAAPDIRDHGTLTAYVIRKCRCDDCTGANRRYAQTVNRLKAYGQWQPYIDAEPARRHVRHLGEHGIGWQRAARLAGVSTGAVNRLLYGQPGRGPSKRIRPETAARLLAVRPSLETAADRATTDATGTRRRAQALVTRGFPQRFIAGRLGMEPTNFSKTLRTPRVAVSTARRMLALYDELWDRDPAEFEIPSRSIEYARRVAEHRGWAPPGAWDDASIDDPSAVPDLGAQMPLPLAVAENVEFIIRTTGVENRDVIAERLRMSRAALDQNLARAKALRRDPGADDAPPSPP
jgi:hypothetical protein